VTKVVKGGKQMSFRAVVAVGDDKGKVGRSCGNVMDEIFWSFGVLGPELAEGLSLSVHHKGRKKLGAVNVAATSATSLSAALSTLVSFCVFGRHFISIRFDSVQFCVRRFQID